LNLGLGSYAAQREAGGGEAVRAFLRALAGDCGVTPSIALSCADGTELSRCRTAVWRDGGVTVYGVLRGAGTPTSAVRVTLPGENEVFSLRRGALGRRSGYELPELSPGAPEFLAVYPYDPGQPEAVASPETPAPGGLVTVHIRLTGVPATETAWFGFTVRLLDPRGMPLEVIPWCALGRGGRASVPVRFAWNDVPGEWRLEAREITTGRAAVACIRLGAAPAPRP
jgi:hypothetical protein